MQNAAMMKEFSRTVLSEQLENRHSECEHCVNPRGGGTTPATLVLWSENTEKEQMRCDQDNT